MAKKQNPDKESVERPKNDPPILQTPEEEAILDRVWDRIPKGLKPSTIKSVHDKAFFLRDIRKPYSSTDPISQNAKNRKENGRKLGLV